MTDYSPLFNYTQFSNGLLNMVATGDFKKDIDPIDIEASVKITVKSRTHANGSMATMFEITVKHNKKVSPLEVIHTLRKDLSSALSNDFIDSILKSIPENDTKKIVMM